LFAQDRPLPEILEEVARLGAQLLMQAALEAEVTEFLGRDRYARAALTEDARPGSRNGYRDVTSRRPPDRSSWPGRSCAAPPRRSLPGCSART
jgi:transposase-like protein